MRGLWSNGAGLWVSCAKAVRISSVSTFFFRLSVSPSVRWSFRLLFLWYSLCSEHLGGKLWRGTTVLFIFH